MFDDFLVRALLAGAGVAAVAGPFGCFVVWRRMAYFGDTMAHASLLGVALMLLVDGNPTVGVFLVALGVALLLASFLRRGDLGADSLLGILSHASLAIALVVIASMTWVRVDLMGYLFGDILAVGRTDLAVIYAGGAAVLAGLAVIWRPLLADTVSPDLAAVDGLSPARARIGMIVLLAGVIAVAIKIVGILLITALLIVPAATARRLSTGPVVMAGLAAGTGTVAAVAGLSASVYTDVPAGPAIVVAAFVLFLASQVVPTRTAK